ncbi:serine hydrolase domain-containing protein [Pseudemcibacter aquimaris]|uniref:serine hydrolase domain-containing protein n=1 Tax=Pseudemcibacter aquimaris TaxID=2857064 RepID=UPI00201309B7|nr:serine hydrolase domain-containing protein [Pseudemcibacter aquimaris]WDU59881.1 beta-lactamase family protein [Pseudemcibacter aquimaris]
MSSISKTFLGSLLGILVERGDINLDDPINNYLPDGVRLKPFNGKEVTILHLATHNGGLPTFPEDFRTTDGTFSEYTLDDLWKSVNDFAPTRAGGDEWHYSTFGIGILSQALAHHFERDYFQMIREEVLLPLGMTETFLHLPTELKGRFAQGHLADGSLTENLVNHGVMYAGGSMITTVNDMEKYVKAHMGLLDTPLYSAFEIGHKIYTENESMGLTWENSTGTINRNHMGTGGGHRAYIGFNKGGNLGTIAFTNIRFGIVAIGHRMLNPDHQLPTYDD